MEENKVISSKITRDFKPLQNNLYDLITVESASPTTPYIAKENSCEFQPFVGKTYIPKKRSKFMKVKTVRDIRDLFEFDVSIDLPKDLEKQQNLLLKKITCGSSREENTKAIVRNILKYDKPISRYSWQMLMNVNPEAHPHAIQYALWNGKRIRVNGSKGGRNKFLFNYDLANIKVPLKKKTKQNAFHMKKSLLRNSLTVKFKPGPLTKKIFLDDSYQKYNVGKTELVTLPKPSLNIQTLYGVSLEPMISDFVQGLRDSDGIITEKWAQFAVSVLGSIKNDEPVQNKNTNGSTFELTYKRDQKIMLFRKDVDITRMEIAESNNVDMQTRKIEEIDIDSNVKTIVKEIIDSVEISLQQESLFNYEDEDIENTCEETANVTNSTKDKNNKRRFCELERLDVTVIRLPNVAEDYVPTTCKNGHCSLGCVCSSLQCSYNLRQHCGRLDCMFECKCDFSKYKVMDTFDSDCSELLPGLINLDNKLNLKLAKEEQKFHQTVVLTGEKSILLKSEKRNWKASKRYGNFYENMCLKNEIESSRLLSIVAVKLNCVNVEPWCMIHNLYKCYCKGRFTENSSTNKVDDSGINETICHDDKAALTKDLVDAKNKNAYRSERNSADRRMEIDTDITMKIDTDACARSRSYKRRKYSDDYYINTNKKIMEMEKNDDGLRKRMLTILNISEDSDTSSQSSKMTSSNVFHHSIHSNDGSSLSENNADEIRPKYPVEPTTNLDSQSSSKDNNVSVDQASNSSFDDEAPDRSMLNASNNRSRLIAWLESSYKQYKQRIEQGIVKKSLDPPKHGRVALYPWEFILSRYRERKNLFLISKQKPFRIFMAVDSNNPFFANCINIDDIRFADLHKYPVTVKNLLTNATDLKDNFNILCGLHFCWELIGSVTKMDGHSNMTDQLQSVADDRKIGFVAQGKDCDSEKTDNNETSTPEDQNSTCPSQSGIGTRSKIRMRNKSKKIKNGAKKMKSFTNNKQENETTEQQDDNSVIDSEKAKNVSINKITKQILDNIFTEVPEINVENKFLQSVSTVAIKKDMLMKELVENEDQAEINLQSSKWFVMTVENDFSEIQFYNRGFFVKYESIIKAINVARMSGKTVRLSSQKGGEQICNNPQFGIYAIPNSSEYYVFIGPYEKDEPLGIETVKSFADIKKSTRTRGVWITTKKVDNARVIDNPLSFMPKHAGTISLENELFSNRQVDDEEVTNNSRSSKDQDESVCVSKGSLVKDKTVKPIKIRKTNGFYQLAPPGFLTHVVSKPVEGTSPSTVRNPTNNLMPPLQLLRQLQSERRPVNVPLLKLPIPRLPIYYNKDKKSESVLKKIVSEDRSQISKPIAEIAPQIKIVDVYSESTAQAGVSRPEGSMFILKPEEINKRLMENASNTRLPSSNGNNSNTSINSSIDLDIENFLATSSAYVPPNADIFEISDEDEDDASFLTSWKSVFIECVSAQIGYIKGRKNADNMLSFEFPGFKFTDFYPEKEAFSKINQVLSRKVYVPKSINLNWRVVENADDLIRNVELSADYLGTDFVLTRRGIRHKSMSVNKSLLKTNDNAGKQKYFPNNAWSVRVTTAVADSKIEKEDANPMDIINELEEKSKALEEEGEELMNKMAEITKLNKDLPDPEEASS